MANQIKDMLGLWHLDDKLVVFNDASLGSGFRVIGNDISLKTPAEVNYFSEKIEGLLNSLPEEYSLQLFYKLNHDVENIIQKHENVSKNCKESYHPIREARVKYLRKNAENREYFVPEIFVFVRSPSHRMKQIRFWQKRESFEAMTKREYDQHRQKFERTMTLVKSVLESAGLFPTEIDPVEWYGNIFTYFNKPRLEEIGLPYLRQDSIDHTLSEQIVLNDISVDKDAITISDLKFRVLTLAILPEGKTHTAMIENFTKLPFHFWISQNLKTLNQKKELSKLELGRRVARSMASGSKNVSDIESETQFEQIESLTRELHEGSEKIVMMDFNVVIWADNQEELETKTDEVLRSFRSLNQAEGIKETYAGLDAFVGAAPSICKGFRLKKIKTSNAAHLLPFYSCWLGNNRPVCLLPNRENSLFSLDPFAKELPNWNGLVFGGSGSGKSFSVAQLMLQFYGQEPNPKIIWIDNGASSQRLLEVLGGEFIDLTLESGISINLFDLEKGELVPSPSRIKMMLGVLELILKDEDKKGLPKRGKALLEESIFRMYQSVKDRVPVLTDLKTILTEHVEPEMRKYAQILFSWTGDTAYGRMLDRPSNVKLKSDLITIEIKGLDNHRELKDIFLLLFTSYIKTEAARDLQTPYLLIIDEAQRLFKTESGRDFAIDCFRTFRKYNAGIYCISQNYRDFLSDKDLAESLMPNTTNVFILRQRKIDWNDFKSSFDFNDSQVEAIKSLEIVKGKYSEFYLMQDKNQAILRLVPEPLSYWICTSDGNEKAKIKEMEDRHPNESKIQILQRLAFENELEKSRK
ncbi:MAG: TraC family protein [Bdellovibrionaceae bacterium]|nr:TraC family protein [Pseudobdellovibrionaceae bacterium]